MMPWKWWHWVVIVVMLLSAAIWVVLVSMWHGEFPALQILPVEVKPTEIERERTVMINLLLRSDPLCHLTKRWWIVDSRGTIILSDVLVTRPNEQRTSIPVHKEYIVPASTASGRAVLHRRLQWDCNLIQSITQPGIDLEPVIVSVR